MLVEGRNLVAYRRGPGGEAIGVSASGTDPESATGCNHRRALVDNFRSVIAWPPPGPDGDDSSPPHSPLQKNTIEHCVVGLEKGLRGENPRRFHR